MQQMTTYNGIRVEPPFTILAFNQVAIISCEHIIQLAMVIFHAASSQKQNKPKANFGLSDWN